jgi:CheY-like chemotaxis protein
LGLAIVRHLVEMHGGTISVHSDGAGQGALFTVALPLHASACQIETAAVPTLGSSSDIDNHEYSQNSNVEISQHSGSQPEKAHVSEAEAERNTSLPQQPGQQALSSATVDDKTLHGLRILVVDDEMDARAMIAAVLAQSGASVIQASSADQALSLLQNESPNLIISDIAMPDLDGYTFIHRVRHADERSRDIPAVALTARARSEDRQHSLDAGFQHHLCKPVDAEDLVKAVAGLALR